MNSKENKQIATLFAKNVLAKFFQLANLQKLVLAKYHIYRFVLAKINPITKWGRDYNN